MTKILLTGGGTGGSVTPLLAVAKKLKEQKSELEFLFLGSKKGPEKELIEEEKIPWQPIFAGKLRRYLSLRNIIDPFFILLAFWQSLGIIIKFKPDIILSAGSFVSVPVVWASWFCRVPILIHQQDIKPGLANKLMAPFARKITVSFVKSLKDFSTKKVVWTGNPVRSEVFQGKQEKAQDFFCLEKDLPTILVLGGGTGSLRLNKVMSNAVFELINFCQIIHSAGRGKNIFQDEKFKDMYRADIFKDTKLSSNQDTEESKYQVIKKDQIKRYHVYEFLGDEISDAYNIADLVISRAGLGTLSELAVLGKPTFIIPMPGTHQENNASYFENHDACVVLSERSLTSEVLVRYIKKFLSDQGRLNKLSVNMKKMMPADAAGKVASEVLKIVGVS